MHSQNILWHHINMEFLPKVNYAELCKKLNRGLAIGGSLNKGLQCQGPPMVATVILTQQITTGSLRTVCGFYK